AARIEVREHQPRVAERGGLAGAGRADHHVPGQRVERVGAALTAGERRRLEGADALLELAVQLLDLGGALGLGGERLLLRLLRYRLLQGPRGARRPDPAEDDDPDD